MTWIVLVLVFCNASSSCDVVGAKAHYIEEGAAELLRDACAKNDACREVRPGFFVVWKRFTKQMESDAKGSI